MSLGCLQSIGEINSPSHVRMQATILNSHLLYHFRENLHNYWWCKKLSIALSSIYGWWWYGFFWGSNCKESWWMDKLRERTLVRCWLKTLQWSSYYGEKIHPIGSIRENRVVYLFPSHCVGFIALLFILSMNVHIYGLQWSFVHWTRTLLFCC